MKQYFNISIIILIAILISGSAKAQQKQKWQVNAYGGTALPVNTYKGVQASADKGWLAGIGTDKYFKCSPFGIGVDARYFENNIQSQAANGFNFANGNVLINYSNGFTFKHLAAGIGPRFRAGIGSSLQVEAYANGGVMFSTYPDYRRDITFTYTYPMPTGTLLWLVQHDFTFNKSNKVKQWMANGGIKVNYKVNKNVKLFVQADYQQSIGDRFFSNTSTQYRKIYSPVVNPITSTSTITGWGTTWPFVSMGNTMPLYNYYFKDPVLSKTAIKTINIAAGVKYAFSPCSKPAPVQKKIDYSLTVQVKDELTGQPLPDADVTITSVEGSSFTGKTDAKGNVAFQKIGSSVYTVTGSLHDVPTDTVTADVSGNNVNATATLIHNDPRFTVKGKTINLSLNRPEPGVTISLTDKDRSTVKMGTSQSNGTFSFQLDANTDYQLSGKKANYISNIEQISTKGLVRSQTLYVDLELSVEQVEIGKSIVLQKIFYDLDKAEIREDASTDLQKLILFLSDNPSYKVEIASHTDARGSDEYNMELSQKRAQAVVSYLVAHGIAKDRLIAKGYGEAKLVNKCANNISCSEEEHQQNRRTEFTLISQ